MGIKSDFRLETLAFPLYEVFVELGGHRRLLSGVNVAFMFVVGDFGGAGELLESESANSHSRVKRHRHHAQVAQLHHRFTVPTGIKDRGGTVDDNTQSSKRGAAFDAANQIVRNLEILHRDGERQVARVHYKRTAFFNNNFLHNVVNWDFGLDVDIRMTRAFENAEFITEP